MPFDYNTIPKNYLDKNDKIGLLIGTLLAGGMGAASGFKGENPLVRGIASASYGFGAGANALQDNYSKMINDAMRRQQQEYEQNMQNDTLNLRKREQDFAENMQFPETQKVNTARINAWNTPKTPEWKQKIDWANASPENLRMFNNTQISQKNTGTYNDFKTLYADKLQGVSLTEQLKLYKEEYLPMIRGSSMIGFDERNKPIFARSGGGGSLNTEEKFEGNIKPKTPSESDIKFERDYTSAIALIDELENKFKSISTSLPKTATERITGYPIRQYGKIMQINPDLVAVDAMRAATLPKLIRALGEVGTLTDADIKRASEAMPTTNDIDEVRTQKFGQLRNLIGEINSRGKRQQYLLPGSQETGYQTTLSTNQLVNDSRIKQLQEMAKQGDADAIEYLKKKGF